MNWKFWTWKFWFGSKLETPSIGEENIFHEKEIVETYQAPNPTLEFPVLKEEETENVKDNLFEDVEAPKIIEPVQDPVLSDPPAKKTSKKAVKKVAPKKSAKKK